MRYGIYVPNFASDFGRDADPRALAALAREAEGAGWDGFFLYDHLTDDAYGLQPGDGIVDPWIALAAIACATRKLLLGPLVTAAARRRPWKLAREIASLDHLCGGRLVFGVGLGGAAAFEPFGEDPADRVRAEKLDEALEIVTGLCSGRPFAFSGRHYRVDETRFLPPTPQQPRVPVWVAGIWPWRRPFARAARWDGVFPLGRERPLPTVAELRDIRAYIEARRESSSAFELVVAGATASASDTRTVAARARAGATWWLEWLLPERGPYKKLRERVRAGPPRA